jgi:uncharacterized protein YndB with AHSA1/START domain
MTTDRTIRLHRVLPAKPEKVYKAFVDADAKTRWLPPNGFTCKVHSFDPKVGGAYKMSFTNFTTGNSHAWTGKFLELKPGELVKYADTFDDPNMPGEMVVTVKLRQVMVGTEMTIEQANVPEQIPLEACYLGWQESLEYLAKLVTPEIPD